MLRPISSTPPRGTTRTVSVESGGITEDARGRLSCLCSRRVRPRRGGRDLRPPPRPGNRLRGADVPWRAGGFRSPAPEFGREGMELKEPG